LSSDNDYTIFDISKNDKLKDCATACHKIPIFESDQLALDYINSLNGKKEGRKFKKDIKVN